MGASRPLFPLPWARLIPGSRRPQPRREKLLRLRPSTIGQGTPETVHGCLGRRLASSPTSDADPPRVRLRQPSGAFQDSLLAGRIADLSECPRGDSAHPCQEVPVTRHQAAGLHIQDALLCEDGDGPVVLESSLRSSASVGCCLHQGRMESKLGGRRQIDRSPESILCHVPPSGGQGDLAGQLMTVRVGGRNGDGSDRRV